MKRKDFSLNKFRSNSSLLEDRNYICFDDKTHDLFVETFCDLILNSKDFDFEIKEAVKQVKGEKLTLKEFENIVRKRLWGTSGNLDRNQYATLLVILSCISNHWNIFPKEK